MSYLLPEVAKDQTPTHFVRVCFYFGCLLPFITHIKGTILSQSSAPQHVQQQASKPKDVKKIDTTVKFMNVGKCM